MYHGITHKQIIDKIEKAAEERALFAEFVANWWAVPVEEVTNIMESKEGDKIDLSLLLKIMELVGLEISVTDFCHSK